MEWLNLYIYIYMYKDVINIFKIIIIFSKNQPYIMLEGAGEI